MNGNHNTVGGRLMFAFLAKMLTQISVSFNTYTELLTACPGHMRIQLLISPIQKDHIIALEQYLPMPAAMQIADVTSPAIAASMVPMCCESIASPSTMSGKFNTRLREPPCHILKKVFVKFKQQNVYETV